KNNLLATANIPEMINYAVASAVVEHTDSISKNFYLSQDPTTGRWSIIPWDLDHTFGHKCCGVNSNFVTPAEPGDQVSELMAAILAVPEWKQMYFRRLRTVVNSVLAPGRLEGVYDAKITPAAPESTLDFAKWPRSAGNLTFAGQRTQLFNAIQARRNVFANDARVPGNQSAAPNIVIDEIQPSVVNGSGGQFVELYNPSATEAVDLSGWSLSGSATLQIQPGTVILPGGRMTFVANDPGFESTYGGLVFVGGVYGGSLGATGTLALNRTDGSTADTLAYGGAGWPTVSDSRSLELVNLASDNTNGANWALSTAAAGSPGAANQTAPVGSLPGSPTIGSATAGGAAATVRWTAPANNGGSAITGYSVRVLDANNVQVGAARPASPTVTSILVTGLTVGTPYTFQVTAINGVGVGAPSASSNQVTPVEILATSRPVISGVTSGAAGGAITATVRWTAPTTTGSGPVVGYQVIALLMSSSAPNAAVLGQSFAPVQPASARQKAFTLTAGTYQFVVIALNAAGFSPPSARSASVLAR
ncbi:MAG: fibronectin type III domain-containing protein, partial [Actinomycetes bacterium]